MIHDMKWHMLFIGECNSGMYIHRDITPLSSWQLLLSGEKKFLFCPPNFSMNSSSFRDDISEIIFSECQQTTISPGDLIYYPKFWYHQTLNTESHTVAISDFVLNDKDPNSDFESFIHNKYHFLIPSKSTEKLSYVTHQVSLDFE